MLTQRLSSWAGASEWMQIPIPPPLAVSHESAVPASFFSCMLSPFPIPCLPAYFFHTGASGDGDSISPHPGKGEERCLTVFHRAGLGDKRNGKMRWEQDM